MSELRHRWVRLMKRLECRDIYSTAEVVLREVLRAYATPHRHYHTAEHLWHCFEVLDRLMPSAPPLIEYALWFHDFVYEPRSPHNEERSAEMAQEWGQKLGLGPVTLPFAGQLILATRHEIVPESPEAKVVVDVDLAILGETQEKFDAYEAQIRKEYAWVPEEDYKAGRRKVLQRFLDREWIYSLPEMRNLGYEGRAQENLRRSIARL